MKVLQVIILAILVSTSCFAQKIRRIKVDVNELILPLEPLAVMKQYDFKVTTPYPENNDDVVAFAKKKYELDVANYPQTVEDAKLKYEEDLGRYEQDVETARENFKLESEAYQSLTAIERLALKDQKPELKLPYKPSYNEPREPVYYEPNLSGSIVFSTEMLAKVNLKVEGFTFGTEQALTGKIDVYDFQNQQPEQKFEEKKVYDSKTKTHITKKVYYYETLVKRPAYVKLSYNGSILYDGVFENTDEYVTVRTEQNPDMKVLEKNSVDDVLEEVKQFINNKYGFENTPRTFTMLGVKNKDNEYDDIEKAFNICSTRFPEFDFYNKGMREEIKEAIALWENALSEADYEDKKARIGQKEAEACLFNLINAYLITYDYEMAEVKLQEIKTLKLSHAEEEYADSLAEMLRDRKLRAKANGL